MVGLLGSAAKHILHSLRHAFILIAITGLVVALIAALATELIGAYLTRSFPTGTTHLAAAALAVAFGYAAAMTVAVAEILRGMILAIDLIVKESERLGADVVREAEKVTRVGEQEITRLGRDAVSDAAATARGAAGLAGGVVGGVAHEAHGVEEGIDSHLPFHHHTAPATVAPSGATTPPPYQS